MSGLTPYNKRNRGLKKSAANIFEEINSLVENFFDNAMPSILSNKIHVDIKENESEYIVEAELPGVDKDEIKIELNHNTLTISVEKNEEIKEERENYIRQERQYGSMMRSFYLENIKDDKVKASYNDGILSIKLPKTAPGKPKRKNIDIN